MKLYDLIIKEISDMELLLKQKMRWLQQESVLPDAS